MSLVPPYPTHPFPVISQSVIDESANRIKARVELWKSIMNNDDMTNWHTLSDYAPIRNRMIHELRLGGIAYPWPGVDYYYKTRPVVGPLSDFIWLASIGC